MEVAGTEKSQARCGHSRGDDVALGLWVAGKEQLRWCGAGDGRIRLGFASTWRRRRPVGMARFDDGARGRAGVGRRWTWAPAAMCAGASTCSLPCLMQEPAPEIQGRRGAMQGLQGSGAERGEGGACGIESKEREGEIERVASGTDAPGGGGRGNREREEAIG